MRFADEMENGGRRGAQPHASSSRRRHPLDPLDPLAPRNVTLQADELRGYGVAGLAFYFEMVNVRMCECQACVRNSGVVLRRPLQQM